MTDAILVVFKLSRFQNTFPAVLRLVGTIIINENYIERNAYASSIASTPVTPALSR